MRKESRLKCQGYLLSSASVLLLAVPAFRSAQESRTMLVCLLLGITGSIAGMAWRWCSHRVEQARIEPRKVVSRRSKRAAFHENGESPC